MTADTTTKTEVITTDGIVLTNTAAIKVKTLLLDRVNEIDRRTAQVGGAHSVRNNSHAAEFANDIAVKAPIVEEELVAKP